MPIRVETRINFARGTIARDAESDRQPGAARPRVVHPRTVTRESKQIWLAM